MLPAFRCRKHDRNGPWCSAGHPACRAFAELENLRQHRTMETAGFGGSFVPIVQYEKWGIHPVFPRFPYYRSGQNTGRISLPHYAVLPLRKCLGSHNEPGQTFYRVSTARCIGGDTRKAPAISPEAVRADGIWEKSQVISAGSCRRKCVIPAKENAMFFRTMSCKNVEKVV